MVVQVAQEFEKQVLMINITDKLQCCGCSACAQRCPKQCISMQSDEEGFLYPKADGSVCIDCGLCEKVCPVINRNDEREPLAVYAAKNADENVRMQSSSGGLFTLLAELTIGQGGVVFGARWDEEWNVRHDCVERKEDIAKLRSSKYLQSAIGESYRKAEMYLREGRQVMFTGTPCQIAGLKHFLRKDYDNLLSVEVICHSVPSPGVWQQYLSEKLQNIGVRKSEIQQISFRDKSTGWKTYSFVIKEKNGNEYRELSSKNAFMRGFLADLYTRPSCQACPAKHLKSGSDITLGDWWGIDSLMPEIDDDRGVSAVTVNTLKGSRALCDLNVQLYSVSYDALVKYNSAIIRSASIAKNRNAFFRQDGRKFDKKIEKLACAPFSFMRVAKCLLHKVFPTSVVKFLKYSIIRS